MQRIAIIGLGLIGGSIGLALRKAGLKDVRVAGVARSRDTARKAQKAGAIDHEARTAAEAAEAAALIVIATPIMTIRSVLEEIAPVLAEGAVVTDVASTKSDVMLAARETLPARAFFVGGHPMAGKEQFGIDAAEAGLFKGKPWIITPSVDSPEGAISTVVGLAQLCGASPIFMDAAEHDAYVAAISHLPLTVAAALFSVAHGSAAWPELAALASSGFRDTTRLASGSPEMAHDIMRTNREHVLHWIDRMQQELTRFRQVIERGDSKELAETFGRAQLERDNYLVNGPPRRESAETPVERVSLGDMLLGSRVAEMLRKQQQILRDMEARAERKR